MQIETVLVILLSIGFIILLGISITLMLIMIKIMNSVRHIAEKAETTTDNLSVIIKDVGKKLAPGLLSAVAAAIFKRVRGGRRH